MLDDLEMNVDKTDSKLSDAMRRMKKFVRQTEGIVYTSYPCYEPARSQYIVRNKIGVVYWYPDCHPHGTPISRHPHIAPGGRLFIPLDFVIIRSFCYHGLRAMQDLSAARWHNLYYCKTRNTRLNILAFTLILLYPQA